MKKIEIEYLSLDEIIPYANNPRKNDVAVDKVVASIKEFGFKNPIILDKENVIVAGHTRLLASRRLNLDKVPCIRADDLSKAQIKAFRIADNRTADEAVWNFEKLKIEFDELQELDFDIDILGFNEDEIETMFDDDGKVKVKDDDFEIVVPEIPISKIGDLWILGRHRLFCGDSTQIENVNILIDENEIDMCLTDPPYNLGYDYNTYDDNKSENDYKLFCETWFNIITEATNKIIITCGKQNLKLWYDIQKPKDIGIWIAKNKMSGGRISFLSLWEPILFYGDFSRDSRPTDLFEYNLKHQEDVGENHTCPKIITFFAELISCYSKTKDNVLDLFGGSGTTLIACEQLDRKCFMMEMDQKYSDVIVDRYIKLMNSNEDVFLVRDGIEIPYAEVTSIIE